jgi:ethanolamine utilization protein EutA
MTESDERTVLAGFGGGHEGTAETVTTEEKKPESSAGFTAARRHISDEETLTLTSVGVDIGSSTSHLVFSRLELEHQGSRYVITKREVLAESEILLTPYVDETTIDSDELGRFIDAQYDNAGLVREDVDTGALILTGVAVRRRNARSIADLFAREAGRFVAVSAGDALETTMAAHGSGAAGNSIGRTAMNVDIGGGTSKVAICQGGKVKEVTAIDVGARLLAMDEQMKVTRIEEAGRYYAKLEGIDLTLGRIMTEAELDRIVARMADQLMELVTLKQLPAEKKHLLRLPELTYRGPVDVITFSGGVSEFIYGREPRNFGDLGARVAKAIRQRVDALGIPVEAPTNGIRATVIGASQYTIQVSGSTIFIAPAHAVPVRNLPAIKPDFPFDGDIDPDSIAAALRKSLVRLGLEEARTPVAVAFHWEGSASFRRLDNFCKGITAALQPILTKGHPLVLVSDGDIGGLLGLHLKEEMKIAAPVISIDGVILEEFDYVDIGALIPSSGAVPVVIKSLVFPAEAKNG